MERRKRSYLLGLLTIVSLSIGSYSAIASDDFSKQSPLITNVYATAYHCVYNSELPGTQTVTTTISNKTYTLKASFLFGGMGVVMQGTGKTAPDGDYVKYAAGAGPFVRLTGPNAGRNPKGQWVIDPQELRDRYARIGITDFAGFGNLALLNPDSATYSITSSLTGSAGQPLTPWLSISTDPSLIPTGQTGTILFKNGDTTPADLPSSNFIAQDSGQYIKGKHIDIYLGEGQSVMDEWNRTGGNRYVDIYYSL
ncbi:MAG: 3D domain-containing protein [Sedimentisphaerales bacterium]|jgi:3D (Asp-Asp-Asp) domain-containing protein